MDCWIDSADLPLCPKHVEDVERVRRRHEGATKLQPTEPAYNWGDYGA